MKLTPEIIDSLVGPSGHPPKSVVLALGMRYPFKKGWKKRLENFNLSARAVQKLLDLKSRPQ